VEHGLRDVAQAQAAVGVPAEEVEAVQARLADAGVFPVTRQDNGTLMIENEPGPVPAGVHDLLAARFQQERTARLAAEEELESARRLIGQGPFVVVKLPKAWLETDSNPGEGPLEVKVGFGGGVTRHMLGAVLSLGQQAVAEEGARLAEQTPRGTVRSIIGGQEETVRLPDGGNFGHGHVRPRADGARARCGGPGLCSECSQEQAQMQPRVAYPSDGSLRRLDSGQLQEWEEGRWHDVAEPPAEKPQELPEPGARL
jgi:hypothetical protein